MACASSAKYGAKKSARIPSATAKGGSIRSHIAPSASKYAIMSPRMPGSSGGHWLRPRKGLPATTSGWSGPRSWLIKKLSFWFGLVALWTVEAPCTEALIGK